MRRFHRWTATVSVHSDVQTWVRDEAPPLDVLMVWHSYMLNPAYVRSSACAHPDCPWAHSLSPRHYYSWYAEDCVRLPVLQALRALNYRLLPAVVRLSPACTLA